jgi:hypothetical protein
MQETLAPTFVLVVSACIDRDGRMGKRKYTRSRDEHEKCPENRKLTLNRGRARFRLGGGSADDMAPALRFPSKLEMLSCRARAAGSECSGGSFSGDGVFDDGTRGSDSSSSVSLPSAGAFSEEWEDRTRLGCAESEEGGNCDSAEGLDAGEDVGAELGTTSPVLESSLGRPKDASLLAESASC